MVVEEWVLCPLAEQEVGHHTEGAETSEADHCERKRQNPSRLQVGAIDTP